MDEVNAYYWYNIWHNDIELHDLLKIKNIKQIFEKKDSGVSVYADTDSIFSDTIIRTNNGKIQIEEWYNNNKKNGSGGSTINGHESVLTDDKIFNYVDGKLYCADVKRIIRHKVTKPKWKLKTKNGKEIIVTNDHSMIVFRDNVQIEVKPSDILITDKILTIIEK